VNSVKTTPSDMDRVMLMIFALLLQVIGSAAQTNDDQFTGLTFDYVSASEDFNGVTKEIGWFEFGSCVEGPNALEFPSGYTLSELVELARYAITVKIIPADKLPTDDTADDFSVKADICSNPIFALGHGYEMSYTLDTSTFDVIGQTSASSPDWIGSDTAKNRLKNTCNEGGSMISYDKPFIYHACGNAYGMHVDIKGRCQWNAQGNLGESMAIWLGFDVDKSTWCELDDSGIYQLTSSQTGVDCSTLDLDTFLSSCSSNYDDLVAGIAANAEDIGTNSGNVGTNSGSIEENSQSIASLTSTIAALNARIDNLVVEIKDGQATPGVIFDFSNKDLLIIGLLVINLAVIALSTYICVSGKAVKYQPVKAYGSE